MRFSEDPAFAGRAVARLDRHDRVHPLTPTPAHPARDKVVYGQFRNDWFSAVRTATITYSPTAPPAPLSGPRTCRADALCPYSLPPAAADKEGPAHGRVRRRLLSCRCAAIRS